MKIKTTDMKSETMGFVRPINSNEMKELTKETKETLATDHLRQPQQHRNFGAIDMWNARRHQRTMASMRRCN